MNPYEKFVSIHNVTNSADLRGLMFPVPIILCWFMPHGVRYWDPLLTSLFRKGGGCLLVRISVISS